MTDFDEARDELADRLVVDDAPPDFDSDPTGYRVEGLAHANRLLRRLVRLDRERAEVRAIADGERDRIDAWERDRTAGIDRARTWIEATLEAFARANHAETGTQTVKLPAGALKLSKPRTRVVVDEAAPEVLAELVARDLARVAPDRAGIARTLKPGPKLGETGGVEVFAAVDTNGEVVDGVVFEANVAMTFKATPATDDGEPF